MDEIGQEHDLLGDESRPSPLLFLGEKGDPDDIEVTWGRGRSARVLGVSVRAWRRARPEAKAVGPVVVENKGVAYDQATKQSRPVTFGGSWSTPESASAWLKRTVEEHTTARPVSVVPGKSLTGLDGLWVSFGREPPRVELFVRSTTLEARDHGGVVALLEVCGWPMSESKPVESTDPLALEKGVAEISEENLALRTKR